MAARLIQDIDESINQVILNRKSLEENCHGMFKKLHNMLEEKEKAALHTYRTVCSNKLKALTQYKDELENLGGPSNTLPDPPVFPSGLCCGFVPDPTSVVQSMGSIIVDYRHPLKEGYKSKASVVGFMNEEGVFWVRILPDKVHIQDIMLLNLSTTISMELSVSPPPRLRPGEVKVGDLCCALYAHDQRWYRAQIVNLLGDNKVNIFFLDYGNVETVAVTTLYPLHQKFQVYPFQMVQCCFSAGEELKYDREVRWEFSEVTCGDELTVEVLQVLPPNNNNLLHLVKIMNHTRSENGQPMDVAKKIIQLVKPAKGKDKPSLKQVTADKGTRAGRDRLDMSRKPLWSPSKLTSTSNHCMDKPQTPTSDPEGHHSSFFNTSTETVPPCTSSSSIAIPNDASNGGSNNDKVFPPSTAKSENSSNGETRKSGKTSVTAMDERTLSLFRRYLSVPDNSPPTKNTSQNSKPANTGMLQSEMESGLGDFLRGNAGRDSLGVDSPSSSITVSQAMPQAEKAGKENTSLKDSSNDGSRLSTRTSCSTKINAKTLSLFRKYLSSENYKSTNTDVVGAPVPHPSSREGVELGSST